MTTAVLKLHDFRLSVFLGWGENERAKLQDINIDIKVIYSTKPRACLNDELDSTVCYDGMTQAIRQRVAGQTFKLIEYLAQEIYKVVRDHVQSDDKVSISVSKAPPVDGLEQATFQLVD